MIEARYLRVLRAVAQSGSFSAAARELGCTQPAVSQQIKALEQAVGVPVVVRSGRTTRLTEAGEALHRHAAGILAGLTAAEEEVAAMAGLRAGRVRLVAFPSGSSSLVPHAVAEVRAAHPGVRVSLVEAEPPEAAAMLRAGDVEIALAFRYPSPSGARLGPAGDDWSDLVVRSLLDDRLVGLVPAGHPLAAAGRVGPVNVAELADEHWIAGCPQCRSHLVDLCESAGFTPLIEFATDDYPAVVGLVAAGLGVAVLPLLALEAVRLAGVAVLPLGPEACREVVALTLPDLVNVPAVDVTLGRLSRAALRISALRDTGASLGLPHTGA
ncbi:transcriptional regulator [Wenjunlia vitaminophila]|uniref:Transcriptional regulator n=1 Tax=Wenjunlia vitaminophila TaxID=76728 RepID=A0A0T6LL60_WENVI|nr:LysR family transcriptional regulator [Wenjunlia vitaminophila]KRV46843.1 transcriptional regulator [Wenjunlia vitaminophila]